MDNQPTREQLEDTQLVDVELQERAEELEQLLMKNPKMAIQPYIIRTPFGSRTSARLVRLKENTNESKEVEGTGEGDAIE